MSSLVPRTTSSLDHSLNVPDQRGLQRDLSRLERRTAQAVSRLEAQAQVESTRVAAATFIGQRAMQAVTMVSQMEGQLAQLCPLATSRLQGIADMTALSIAQIVNETSWRLS